MRKFDENDFEILLGTPHDDVVKILKRNGIEKEPGGGVRYDDIRQYIFTDYVRGGEYLVDFKIGGTRALDRIIVNIP